MKDRFRRLALALVLLAALPAQASSVKPLHRFANTGKSTPSEFALGANPVSELVQASDGNFYGTTQLGGSGACAASGGSVSGCGTIFRMTPQGTVTTLYSFLYDASSNTAANGAYPKAGLIQAKDGYLYGVASDGGVYGCNGSLGCGTLFRISTSGSFTRLHQFCNNQTCPGSMEGGDPKAHLVQRVDGSLCGTTAQGGFENEGTLFCATTGGAVSTLYDFEYENGTNGYDPEGALLLGADGRTLYGNTIFGGAGGGGTVFAYQRGNAITILHAFDSVESQAAGTYFEPMGALILGADGRLYGTTYSGGSGGGCIYSVNTDGTGFAIGYDFNANASSNAPGFPVTGLVLARDGMMYGNTLFGSIEQTYGLDNGIAFRFDPAKGRFKALADFNSTVGAAPRAAEIEASDKFLYGTTSVYGGSNPRGQNDGTLYRLTPALSE